MRWRKCRFDGALKVNEVTGQRSEDLRTSSFALLDEPEQYMISIDVAMPKSGGCLTRQDERTPTA